MGNEPNPGGDPLSASRFQQMDELCDRFEEAWERGPRPRIEDYLGAHSQLGRATVLQELLCLELTYRRQYGETPCVDDYRRRFPEDAELVDEVFRQVQRSLEHATRASLLAGWEDRGAACHQRDRPELEQGIESLRDLTGPPDSATSPDMSRSLRAPPATADPTFTGYNVVRELGRGGMGVVYQAFDRKRGEQVALKTLQRLDAATLYRFKQEFRGLADLAHPNLVALHELVSDGHTWFFTMDLVEGVDFLHHVHSEPGISRPTGLSPLQLARLRAALPQLAEAVAALHAAGKLHRDIKPTNVLVRADGRVILLDFGLAADLDQAGLHFSTEEHIVGTVAYMAPEQAEGHPVSTVSDWYSVGVMLFQALTGRLPYRGGVLQMLLAKQRLDPPPPRALLPGVPEDLNALCLGLLNRRPEERPSGEEVLRRLGATASLSAPSGEKRECPSIRKGPVPASATPFVGRERPLEALSDAFRATRLGRPIVVYIRGRSGQGKTALVQRFLDGLAERDEAVILAGRCHEQESVPYKGIDSLIDALSCYLRRLARSQAEAVMPRDVAALTRLFPVLRRVAAVAEAPRQASEAPDQQELRRRGFAALRELLARLGDRKPLVLFIDDLQWGDVDSAALLSELLRPPDAAVLLLLGCFRSEDEIASPCLAALRETLEKAGNMLDVRRLTVGPLTPAEARALARALLGQEAAVTAAHIDTVVRESGGDPFFVYELVQHLRAGDPGASVATQDLSLDQVLGMRLERLPAESRRLLEIVAVARGPLDWAVACSAARLRAQAHAALGLLRVGRLVRSSRLEGQKEGIETFHDRIREAALARLPQAAVKGYHEHLAVALEAEGDADPETLAVHFHGAEDFAQAAQYYTAAADKAAEALAFDRAAKLYRLALDLRPGERASEQKLRQKLGDALANAGRGAQAAREYLAATPAVTGPEALELWRRAAYQYCISGHIREGWGALERVLTQLGMRMPRTRRGALLSLLVGRVLLRLRGLHWRERRVEQLAPQEQARIDVSWTAAVGLTMIDTIRGADFQTRNLLLALRAGEPYRLARALAWQAGHVSTAGQTSKSRVARLLQAAEALTARIHEPAAHGHALGLVGLASGIALYFQGRWQEALRCCDRADGLFRDHCTGVVWERVTARSFALWSLFFLGEVAELSKRLPGLLREGRARTDLLAEASVINFGGTLSRLAADDPEGARHSLDEVMAKWQGGDFHTQHFTALAGQTYIDLYCRRGLVAWERLTRHWQGLAGSLLLKIQAIRVFMLHLRARSALAAAEDASSPAALLRAAARDARRLQREKIHWAGPLASLIHAALAARRGENPQATALLTRAGEGFAAADMKLFAAAARRRHGELIGGDRGAALVAAADGWMKGQGIQDPAAMTALHAPGFGSSAL